MIKIKSTVKHEFELSLQLDELSNIPQLSGSAYCKLTVSNHRKSVKFQDFTRHAEIKNNRCHLNYSLSKKFKVYQDTRHNRVLPLNARLEFVSVISHNQKTVLGVLNLNLCEFLKYSTGDRKPVRYLLDDSKINSIVKLSISWTAKSIAHTDGKQWHESVPDPEEHDYGGLEEAKDLVATPTSAQAPQSQDIEANTSCVNVAGEEGQIITHPELISMINKSFEIPWNDEYEEFTPDEAVADIFDGNGIGFKKNEEGMLLVDLYNFTRRRHSALVPTPNNGAESSADESSSEDEEGDDADNVSWFKNEEFPHTKKKRAAVRKTIDEKALRPDLKSWIITN